MLTPLVYLATEDYVNEANKVFVKKIETIGALTQTNINDFDQELYSCWHKILEKNFERLETYYMNEILLIPETVNIEKEIEYRTNNENLKNKLKIYENNEKLKQLQELEDKEDSEMIKNQELIEKIINQNTQLGEYLNKLQKNLETKTANTNDILAATSGLDDSDTIEKIITGVELVKKKTDHAKEVLQSFFKKLIETKKNNDSVKQRKKPKIL